MHIRQALHQLSYSHKPIFAINLLDTELYSVAHTVLTLAAILAKKDFLKLGLMAHPCNFTSKTDAGGL